MVQITLESGIEEWKEIMVLSLSITKAEEPQILSADNMCCI